MDRLKRLEHDWELFKTGCWEHDCLLELVGMCPTCESYQDMKDEIWDELQEERRLLPGYLEKQSKQRLACTCREMDLPLRINLFDRIIEFATLVNDRSN